MTLKQKSYLVALAFIGVFSVFFCIQIIQKPSLAEAKIRIETQFSDTGAPLLLTQAKGITQQTTMEELLRRIGRWHSSQEENQKEILEIQKHIQVIRQENTEIFLIQVRHKDSRWAREIANQLAQAFQITEQKEARENAKATEEAMERQILQAREEVETIEKKFNALKAMNKPTDVDISLENHLRKKEGEYVALKEIYTDLHPDVIELRKQIESLQLQIQDGPPRDYEGMKQAEQDLRNADSHYRNLRKKLDDLRLDREKLSGKVQILELSSASSSRKTSPPWALIVIFAALVLLVLVIILTRRT